MIVSVSFDGCKDSANEGNGQIFMSFKGVYSSTSRVYNSVSSVPLWLFPPKVEKKLVFPFLDTQGAPWTMEGWAFSPFCKKKLSKKRPSEKDEIESGKRRNRTFLKEKYGWRVEKWHFRRRKPMV